MIEPRTLVMTATVHPDGSVVWVLYDGTHPVLDAVLAVVGAPMAEAVLSAEEAARLSAMHVGGLLIHDEPEAVDDDAH